MKDRRWFFRLAASVCASCGIQPAETSSAEAPPEITNTGNILRIFADTSSRKVWFESLLYFEPGTVINIQLHETAVACEVLSTEEKRPSDESDNTWWMYEAMVS